MSELGVGQQVRLLAAQQARVVATEMHIPLSAGSIGYVDEVVPEFHQALISVTPAGPRVWIDLDDLSAA